MVICLERGADLHMAQLMPLPLTVSCFSKVQIGFTFLVPAHPDSPGKSAVKRVCMCIPHDKHNQNINCCSALCVFIGCLFMSKGGECLAQNYWTAGYDPVNDLSEIWTAVHTEIVCRRIIPSAVGAILSISAATGVEQLLLLFKL